MPNTLTGLTPEAEIRVLEVARETSAMTRFVTNNTEDMSIPVGMGETVDINVMNDFTTRDVVPAATAPATAQNDINPVTNRLTLDQHKAADMIITNREWLAIQAGKSEAFDGLVRAVVNDINSSLTGLYRFVSQFSGVAGTTPFTANTQILKGSNNALNKARAPFDRRSLVLDPLAYGEATQLQVFQTVNQSGSSEALRDAMISRGIGYDWGMDQLVAEHTSNAAGVYALVGVIAAGSTTVTVDNGAGALPANALIPGDLFTIAGSTRQHTVISYTPGGANASVVISPGIENASAGGEVMTVVATHMANLAFHPQAFHLAVRPEDRLNLGAVGESRSNRLWRSVVDTISGIALTVEVYEEYHQARVEVSALWGVVCARPDFAVRILG